MKLLALDAATTACSVACWSKDAVTAQREEIAGRRQAEILMPMVKSTMQEAGFDYPMLDAIAVTNGPGSFTGVRIGLATARGLALAAGLPLTGVTTLQALTAAPSEDERRGRIILATLDARRDQLYGQFFDENGDPAGDPFAAAAESIPGRLERIFGDGTPLLLVGSGTELAARALDQSGRRYRCSESPPFPHAATIAALVARRGFDRAAGEPVAPFYLRDPGIGPATPDREAG
ncbi:MAG: tRNA (adenosine(37)-N6)-threonylcarbamoyltransferase complex dimerization subunit type 1 TsaB [Alphaproteobacteria bacterium]